MMSWNVIIKVLRLGGGRGKLRKQVNKNILYKKVGGIWD